VSGNVEIISIMLSYKTRHYSSIVDGKFVRSARQEPFWKIVVGNRSDAAASAYFQALGCDERGVIVAAERLRVSPLPADSTAEFEFNPAGGDAVDWTLSSMVVQSLSAAGPDPVAQMTPGFKIRLGHRMPLPEPPRERKVWGALVGALLAVVGLIIATNAWATLHSPSGGDENIAALVIGFLIAAASSVTAVMCTRSLLTMDKKRYLDRPIYDGALPA
jgi:hypothetical protein